MRCPKARRGRDRRATVLIECALTYPIAMLLLLGQVVLGLGIYRQQQLTLLAAEAARWAAVRGQDYQDEQAQPAFDGEDLTRLAVLARAVAIDPGQLQVDHERVAGNKAVRVDLTYEWKPEALVLPITFRASAVAPFLY